MPRTRRVESPSVDIDEESEHDAQQQGLGNVVMSPGQFSALLETFTRTQAEANRNFAERLSSSTPQQLSMSTMAPPGSFTKCTARFAGTSADSGELDAFLDAVEIYKDCANVSNDNALRGLPMLLEGHAAIWWQGVKSSTSDWGEAIVKLRSAFGKRRSPPTIYRELFSLSQGEESTDQFVAKVRALLSKLPKGDLTEKVELDMIYSLLHRRIKKRLDRCSISSFENLLVKARNIEDSLKESSSMQQSCSNGTEPLTTGAPPPTVPATASSSAPLAKSPDAFCAITSQNGR